MRDETFRAVTNKVLFLTNQGAAQSHRGVEEVHQKRNVVTEKPDGNTEQGVVVL